MKTSFVSVITLLSDNFEMNFNIETFTTFHLNVMKWLRSHRMYFYLWRVQGH